MSSRKNASFAIIGIFIIAAVATTIFFFKAKSLSEEGASLLETSGATEKSQNLNVQTSAPQTSVAATQSSRGDVDLSRLNASIPENMKARSRFVLERQIEDVVHVVLQVDGVPVEGSERTLKAGASGLEDVAGAMPSFENFPEQAFPETEDSAWRERAQKRLGDVGVAGLKIEKIEKSWAQNRSSGVWQATVQVFALSKRADNQSKKEVLRFDANTAEALQSHSRIRAWQAKAQDR